tara:strand:+ start:4235 stop:4891 length:657 start_codon:yes stop_codon:yes gene_type:complete
MITSITKIGLAAILSIVCLPEVIAQNAEALLTKLSDKANNYETVSASYTSEMVDLKNDFNESMEGEIIIEGDKFNLDLGEYVVISDGLTVWTYDTESNECYIDDAKILIEDGMDPSKIFTIWEDNFTTEWKGRLLVNGKDCVQINLYPSGDDEKSFHTLQLFIDDEAMEVVRLIVKGREGTDTEYSISQFETGVQISNDVFKFSENKYPGVSIIDNRI